MARTWLSVWVELLGGRGDQLWPWPGRIFAVGPGHTFEDLAEAINDAFARWDRSHLSTFTLADGRVVTDEETGAEAANSMVGPLIKPLDYSTTKVAGTLQQGEEFKFVFDLGDNWTHRCVVEHGKVDPVDVLGIRPKSPLPYWGWGTIPDQYGRRWSDDDGESPLSPRPSQRHPMLMLWPDHQDMADIDIGAVRRSMMDADASAFLAAAFGRNIDHALQQMGPGVLMALQQRRDESELMALSVINRLIFRGFPGDYELSQVLLAALRREPLEAATLPVDLDILTLLLEEDPEIVTGAYVDLETGAVFTEEATDPVTVGEEHAIDLDRDPDRWLWLERFDSQVGWEDMAAFATLQGRLGRRERMEQAIDGAGAFARFRQLIEEEGLIDTWKVFAADRKVGRARQLLATEGITVALGPR